MRDRSWRTGRALHAEPYKSELLPLWSFKDAKAAKKAAQDTSTSASSVTTQRVSSSGWTSRGTTCRWVTPTRDATRTLQGREQEQALGKARLREEPGGGIFYKKWRKAAEDEEVQCGRQVKVPDTLRSLCAAPCSNAARLSIAGVGKEAERPISAGPAG
jgi:hypothetical protein